MNQRVSTSFTPLFALYKLLNYIYQFTKMGRVMNNRCFTMLKPGVLNRRHVGEVISRFEHKGLKLIGLKMMRIDKELAEAHYAEHVKKSFYEELISYIIKAPVVAMVWQGDDCVSVVRKMVGATKPTEAAPGTIRGDFCMHTNLNIIHASDSDKAAEAEIALFFRDNELFDWDDPLNTWI